MQEIDKSNLQHIFKIRRRKLVFFLGALLTILALFLFVKNLFVSFLLAFVMYFILNPAVEFLERKGLSRTHATIVPFVLVSVLMAVLTRVFLPTLMTQFASLQSEFPRYSEGILQLIVKIQMQVAEFLPQDVAINLAQQVQSRLTDFAKNFFVDIPEYLSSSMTILFLSPLLGFFLLSDGRNFVRSLLALVPNNSFELALNLNHQISEQLGGFVRARIIETVIVALFIWIGLSVIGFPYALTLAIFAGLLNLIPYLGPIIGALPAFLIAALTPNHPDAYFWLTVIYGGAQVIDTVVLVPFLVAKIVNLHPIVVILSIILGSQVLGVLGMIISIPVAAAIKVTTMSLYSHLTEFRD